MPVCNRCESEFDVEVAPGALMFGHPSTVKQAVPVWKAHICQPCEDEIVSEWKLPPVHAASKSEKELLCMLSKVLEWMEINGGFTEEIYHDIHDLLTESQRGSTEHGG